MLLLRFMFHLFHLNFWLYFRGLVTEARYWIHGLQTTFDHHVLHRMCQTNGVQKGGGTV
jgi:hypothetical protein